MYQIYTIISRKFYVFSKRQTVLNIQPGSLMISASMFLKWIIRISKNMKDYLIIMIKEQSRIQR